MESELDRARLARAKATGIDIYSEYRKYLYVESNDSLGSLDPRLLDLCVAITAPNGDFLTQLAGASEITSYVEPLAAS